MSLACLSFFFLACFASKFTITYGKSVDDDLCNKALLSGLPPFYRVYKLEKDEDITIDGHITEGAWLNVPAVEDFMSIYGSKFQNRYKEETPWKKTSAKILWSERFLYVSAILEEDQIWGTDFGWKLPTKQLDPSNPRPPCDQPSSKTMFPTCPFRNGDFEFFISPSRDGAGYKEFEFNANVEPKWNNGLGPAVMTLSFPRPYNDLHGEIELWLNNETNEDLKGMEYSVTATSPINDPTQEGKKGSWSVEVKVPLQYLLRNTTGEYPNDGVVWRHAFSRVEYRLKPSVATGNYEPFLKTPIEIEQGHFDRNFVWPPTFMYDIHMPDLWGAIVFTTKSTPDNNSKSLSFNNGHPLKGLWGVYGTLSRIYHAQWAFQTDNNRTSLLLPELRRAFEQLSNESVKTPFKNMKQIYAFYSVPMVAWSPTCMNIRIKQDKETGWKAWVKQYDSNAWWSIDGWRRIKKEGVRFKQPKQAVLKI